MRAASAAARETGDRLGPRCPARRTAPSSSPPRSRGAWRSSTAAASWPPVARRWKGQFNENAKHWAFYEALPELDHNAVMGYQFPAARGASATGRLPARAAPAPAAQPALADHGRAARAPGHPTPAGRSLGRRAAGPARERDRLWRLDELLSRAAERRRSHGHRGDRLPEGAASGGRVTVLFVDYLGPADLFKDDAGRDPGARGRGAAHARARRRRAAPGRGERLRRAWRSGSRSARTSSSSATGAAWRRK